MNLSIIWGCSFLRIKKKSFLGKFEDFISVDTQEEEIVNITVFKMIECL